MRARGTTRILGGTRLSFGEQRKCPGRRPLRVSGSAQGIRKTQARASTAGGLLVRRDERGAWRIWAVEQGCKGGAGAMRAGDGGSHSSLGDPLFRP